VRNASSFSLTVTNTCAAVVLTPTAISNLLQGVYLVSVVTNRRAPKPRILIDTFRVLGLLTEPPLRYLLHRGLGIWKLSVR